MLALRLLSLLIQAFGVVLVADFVSGFFHWLEDAYGREHWPITGRLFTRPNILHHHEPRYFLRHNWWQSSWDLMCICGMLVLVAFMIHRLTWHVWLFALLGTNANQFHKWAHRTPRENGPLIAMLQRMRLIQSAQHHARHHTDPKESHYCVITNLVNPLVDGIQLWAGLEWLLRVTIGARRRVDASLRANQAESPAIAGGGTGGGTAVEGAAAAAPPVTVGCRQTASSASAMAAMAGPVTIPSAPKT
jgi:ubiquitin-conjugating enzyme E2 variant